MTEIIAACVAFAALIVILAVTFIGRARPHLAEEDWTQEDTEELPIVPEPTVCARCQGELWILHTVRGYTVEVPCEDCWCATCGRRITNGLCNECEEPCPTPNPTPPAPTANLRTRDEQTSTSPTRAGVETPQPDGEWDLAERTYERGQDV